MIKRTLFLLSILLLTAQFGNAQTTVQLTDTISIKDTVYLYDTTVAVQKQMLDLKENFYDKAVESLDYRMTTITVLLTIIAIVFVAFSIYLFLITKRSKEDIDRELKLTKHDLNNEFKNCIAELREDTANRHKEIEDFKRETKENIDKSLKEALERIEQLEKEAIERVTDIAKKHRQIRKRLADINSETAKKIGNAEKKAEEDYVTDPTKIAKYIKKIDATESIEEYENILSLLDADIISRDIIPSSLHRSMGFNYYYQKKYKIALEEFSNYLIDNPEDELILFSAAYCNSKLKQYQEAINFYKMVIKLNPKKGFAQAAFNNWGQALIVHYDEVNDISLLDEAISKFEKAIEINNRESNPYNNWCATLIHKYHQLGEKSFLIEAHEKVKKAIELAPEDKSRFYNLACVESLLGKSKDEMFEHLKTAIDYDNKYKKEAREDKDFEKYWDDPEFVALTKED